MENVSLRNQNRQKKHDTISNAKVFENLPHVLIQDSSFGCAYYIESGDLKRFKVSGETWEHITPGTVTFVIPDENYLEEAPPFTQYGTEKPSVLVQFPKGEEAFFLTHEDLQEFKIEQPKNQPTGSMSFVIPRGTELWDELPAMRAHDLQSNEN